MAKKQAPTVGVVLINDLGLYRSKMFGPVSRLLMCPKRSSFLIGNRNMFYGGNRSIDPPAEDFNNKYRPPEYGKPLFLMAEGKVPEETIKSYMRTYSLEGKFGKITDLGYICVPDIEEICQHITSPNPLLQKQARLIMDRDRTIIDILYMCLETREDVRDPEQLARVVRAAFVSFDYLKYIPLEVPIAINQVALDRGSRLDYANGDEAKYAAAALSATDDIIQLGKQWMNAPVNVVRFDTRSENTQKSLKNNEKIFENNEKIIEKPAEKEAERQ